MNIKTSIGQSFPAFVDDGQIYCVGNKIVRRFVNKARDGKKYDLNDLQEDFIEGLFLDNQ